LFELPQLTKNIYCDLFEMPPVTVNAGRNRRGRPRNILADNVTVNSRRPGRLSGQAVRAWGTRIPVAGDRIEDARIIGSAAATWK
jgi:hypothetical protein